MADALWPFADQFRVWHTSPPNGPPSFFRLSNEFHEAGCPLKFQGTAKSLWQVFDSTADPPYPITQYPYLSLKEFVCWLQLPSDVTGTDWYFGYVFFDQSKHRAKLFSEFRELAAQAGACLRKNPRFREWLWPCLQYLSQADRYPQLRDGEDIAWWVALLFTKPDLCQLLHAACSRSDIADVVQFQIENPALWSREAIRSRQLIGDPLWPTASCRVAGPFREIPCQNFVEPPAMQHERETDLANDKARGVRCTIEILEWLGWRVSNNRRRLKRLEYNLQDARKKGTTTTALEAEGDELKVQLARYEDLLNDCAEWIRVRTGIARDKLVEVATSTAFTEGKDRDDIYAELRKLDERGLTAESWTNLLSQDRDALVSVKLLPSLESSQPTSAADEHRGEPADEQQALKETLARIDIWLTQPVAPLPPAPAIPQELTTRLGAIESAIESLKPPAQSEFAPPVVTMPLVAPTQRAGCAAADAGKSNAEQDGPTPAQLLALRAFDYARDREANSELSPREAYEFWMDKQRGLADEDRDKFPELVGYDPGTFSSFETNLSKARNHPAIDRRVYGRRKDNRKGQKRRNGQKMIDDGET